MYSVSGACQERSSVVEFIKILCRLVGALLGAASVLHVLHNVISKQQITPYK